MIPNRVIRHVQRQLETLRALARARQTDERFAGGGRYEGESYLNHQPALDQAWKALSEFERLCRDNGEDPRTLYDKHGWPERLSAAAKAWLPPGTHVPAEAVAADADSVAWLESGASDQDVQRILRAGGYGAILLNERAQLELQDLLDSLLEQRLVNVRNALRELGWAGEAYKPLHRDLGARTWRLAHNEKKVGFGRNVVSLEYMVFEASATRGEALLRFSDPMRVPAKALAALCEEALQEQLRVMRSPTGAFHSDAPARLGPDSESPPFADSADSPHLSGP